MLVDMCTCNCLYGPVCVCVGGGGVGEEGEMGILCDSNPTVRLSLTVQVAPF